MLTTLEMQCACLAVCLGSSFPARNPFLQFSAQVQGFSFLQAEAGSGGAVPWGSFPVVPGRCLSTLSLSATLTVFTCLSSPSFTHFLPCGALTADLSKHRAVSRPHPFVSQTN